MVYTPPSVTSVAFDFLQPYFRGSLNTNPSGDFFVFLPTCVWSANSTEPQSVTFVSKTQTGAGFTATFQAKIDPSGLKIDWGDGTTSTGQTQSGASFLQGQCPDTNRHVYKKVSQGLYISATETLTATVSISWTDSNGFHQLPSQAITQNLVWPVSGPHPVYQIEGVPQS